MTTEIKNKMSEKDSEHLDLGRLIGEIIDYRKLIIAVTMAFTVMAILYALFATPIYQANALIQVEQKQGNAILNSLNQMLPDGQPQSAPEIALLQSRMILGKTVDDLNLQYHIEEEYLPIVGSGLARLLGEKSGTLDIAHLELHASNETSPVIKFTVINNKKYRIEGENFAAEGQVGVKLDNAYLSILVNEIKASKGTVFTIQQYSRLTAIAKLQDMFNVTDQGKDTGILLLTVTGDDSELVRKILDNISENYLEQNVARQAAQNEKSLEFLNEQLPKVRQELDVAEDKLNTYRRQQDSVDLSLEAKAVLDQIVNIDNQLNQLTFKEAEISQLYTKEHPTFKALLEKRQVLQQERKKLNAKVSAMPSTQQEVLRLSRDVESGRAVYMQLLNRQQELSIAKSSAIGNVRIIDTAITQPAPVKPKKILVVLIGIVLGFLVSIAIVLFRVLLRRGIESPEQLEEIGVNVYASVPISEALTKNNKFNGTHKQQKTETLLAITDPADLAIEAIRGLRTSIHFAMMEARNNILMISGASPNAGKTFISTNLAAVISQTGKRILFIDADLRKGYVHEIFTTKSKVGLSEYLSEERDINEIIVTIENCGLDFIPRGQVPPNPAELLMHERFNNLIEQVKNKYDLVIIDTPPILAVTDATIVGRYAGTSLLVARFEENTVKEISVSIKRCEQAGITIKGCIINGVIRKASSYYSYGYSNYGYSYSDKK
ncbi:TPA: polysaccharide biosynthesis tyrosine autokinase [Klebsiella pneumoniae]|uniref:Tyrosine-protein kinase n=2 Tax=Klebsiella pneumoniae TaxID=573 RepID=A0A1C3SZM1_KLEPN|nr:polysaccharide biosynthesis tyrosine autokinase [Klebsiella pneumoniae]ELC0800808.1 polysaccharide biosynthesis tyrosine autokinase [Klebsiella pneumoniae]ELL9838235.1 polysaccharide biosynthesis tyrosine autokinase [Klebsiella pneumoniae]ELQ4794577.1 polysaccharide biosynthesis tyrosine autokinase [Klebsiella pneumoniae]MCP6173521.1 polysaccharide biosynthesis tyrosine autokinase [Klebsiella pneumoniae]MCP6270508.1 polysaccharide biosynthesis tyrosine autokinase [Klebsiella pneumoniae]